MASSHEGDKGLKISTVSTQLRRLNLQAQAPTSASRRHNSIKMAPTDFIQPHKIQNVDPDDLIALTDELIRFLDTPRDATRLAEAQEEVSRLQSLCEEDWSDVQTLCKVIQEKVLLCEQKVEAAEKEGVADEELEGLRNELEDELQSEQQLKQELRKIEDEMDSLEMQRVRIEGHKEALNKAKAEELRVQNEISLYASVTKIIPDLNEMEKAVGHLVDKEKRIVEKFEFDPTKTSEIEICNRLWGLVKYQL
eukprot:Gb_07102 [translate_table: standard]